jgi:acetyl esterase/lipase
MLLSFLMAMGAAVRARITRGVVYGPQPGARLDVYAPIGADGEAPVVVFARFTPKSGGGRQLFRFVGQTLASRGFVTVIPDVRGEGDAPCGDSAGDLALAVAWARSHCGGYGGDPSRLFLMGHAGGAHCVAMLALDPRWLGAVDMRPGDLRGAIGVSGLYDALPAGCPADHANPSAPPLLLIAGQRDGVDPDNTSRLARALRTVGGQVAEIRYPKLGDRLGLQSLARPMRYRATALEEVERFVRFYSLAPVR